MCVHMCAFLTSGWECPGRPSQDQTWKRHWGMPSISQSPPPAEIECSRCTHTHTDACLQKAEAAYNYRFIIFI